MHLRAFTLHPESYPTLERYPFRLPLLQLTRRVELSSPVTLFVGENGSGKSTLLKLLARQIAPLAGHCEVCVETAYLDQHLSTLAPDASILDQMIAPNGAAGAGALRTRLALLGLNADRVLLPTRMLSGGERLKAALARALYVEQPTRLLLLDEPGNHLDLASVQALEAMLCQYQGALIVVSHDEVLLGNLQLTHRLEPTAGGWTMSAW